jgi:hypothetical protein
MFKERMKTDAIPERVFALCCALKKKPLSRDALRECVEPDEYAASSMRYFSNVFAAAIQLDVISESEGEISLKIGREKLTNMDEFRKEIAPRAFDDITSLFFQVTKAYLDANEEILEFNNVSKMSDFIQSKVVNGMTVFEDDMRAWRFWASYLGIGIIHDMFVIPNMFVRVNDIMNTIKFEKKKELTVTEFIQNIQPLCKEALLNLVQKNINMGFSNGLRQLHDLGRIELKYMPDSNDIWYLHKMEEHVIQSGVTHILIKG